MSAALPVLFSGAQVRVTEHRAGLEHVSATIRQMAALAREGSHSFEIVDLARRIVHAVPSKQVRAELEQLYRWVRDHIRYRFDPVGLEWVQSPARTIQQRAGDCDDIATLLASLAGALGHEWRFRTIGPTAQRQKHITAEAFDGRAWVTLDPVLEPPATTTGPRAELGRFGHKAAGGFEHIWSKEGTLMPAHNLSGAVTPWDVAVWRGHLGLTGVPTAQQSRLWTDGSVAYYPQVGRVGPGAGVASKPVWTYGPQGVQHIEQWVFRPYGSTQGATLRGEFAMLSGVLVLPYGVVDTSRRGPLGGHPFFFEPSALGRTTAGADADTPDRLRFVWMWYEFEPPAKRPKGWSPNASDKTIHAWWSSLKPDYRVLFRESYAATVDYAPKNLNDRGKREWWTKQGKDARVRMRGKYSGGFWGDVAKVGEAIIKPIAKVHAATTGQITSLLHKVTHTGPIRDIEKQVQGIVGQVPFFKPFIDFHENTSARLTEQVMVKTGAIKASQARGPVKKPTLQQSAELLDKGSGGRITPEKGIQAAGQAAGKAAGGVNIKLPASVKKVGAAALKSPVVKAGAARAASGVLKAAAGTPAGKAVTNVVSAAAKAAGVKQVSAAVAKAQSVRRPNWKNPHPDVRAKYPSTARQVFDAKSNLFAVYVPTSTTRAIGLQARAAVPVRVGMNGLGFVRPTISFALGATAAPAPASSMTLSTYKKNMAVLANAAVQAVNAFIAKNKISPGGKLPQVNEFQRYDALRKNGGFTGTPLAVDGVWGNNTRAAAAWYLDKPVTSMPAVKPAVAKQSALTWTPPVKAAVVAAVSKPAPAPAPKPSSSKPVVTVTPAGTHAVPVTPVKPVATTAKPPAPKPAPKPSPSGNVTGYQQVGTEVNNPGLPPLGAKPVIDVTPAGTHAVPVKPAPAPAPKPPAVKPSAPAPVAYKPPPPAPPSPPGDYPGSPTRPIVIDAPLPVPQAAPAPLPAPLLPAGPGGPTYDDLPAAPPLAPAPSAGSDNTWMLIALAAAAYAVTRSKART